MYLPFRSLTILITIRMSARTDHPPRLVLRSMRSLTRGRKLRYRSSADCAMILRVEVTRNHRSTRGGERSVVMGVDSILSTHPYSWTRRNHPRVERRPLGPSRDVRTDIAAIARRSHGITRSALGKPPLLRRLILRRPGDCPGCDDYIVSRHTVQVMLSAAHRFCA